DCLRRHLVAEDRAHLTHESEDVTMHGFRSAHRDYCGYHRVEEEFILEMNIAHIAGSKAVLAYRRDKVQEARRRPGAEVWEAYCASGAQTTADAPAANVVPFSKAA